MQRTYRITLRNQDPTLDLRRWVPAIGDVIGFCQGRYADSEGVGINRESLEIRQHELLMEVEENVRHWHRQFGRRLANEHNMRHLCDPNDQTRMFDWEEIER
jgi:hypothetical protein